jgi:hypothetical protein
MMDLAYCRLQQLNLFPQNGTEFQPLNSAKLSSIVPHAVQHEATLKDREDAAKVDLDGIAGDLRQMVDKCMRLRNAAQLSIDENRIIVDKCDAWIRYLGLMLSSEANGNYSSLEGNRIAESQTVKVATGRNGTAPHKEIIVGILRRANRSMSTSAISRQAFQEGSISSSKGYRGVYSSVTTTLKRYQKNLFVRARRGLWDLRERRIQNKASPSWDASIVVRDKKKGVVYTDLPRCSDSVARLN